MIELLFIACLASDPDQCRERSLLFTGVSPMQCLMGAQPELAKWVNTHPNVRVKSWRCRTVNTAEMDI